MLIPHNFGVATVSTGYDAAATTVVLTSGHGAKLGSLGPSRGVWWNITDFPTNPWDDPNREIIEFTRSTDTLTVIRGLETSFGGLAASTKNTAGKTYAIALIQTAETAMRERVDPDHEVLFFDDFLYAAGQTPSDRWKILVDSNRSTWNWQRDDSVPSGLSGKNSGFAKAITDATSQRAGFWQLVQSFGDWGPFLTGGRMTYDIRLWTPNEAVSDATNDYTIRVGLGLTTATYGNVANGMWFEYNHAVNSGQWRFVSRQAGSATNLDSSVAVSAGGEYHLKFVRNAAADSIDVWINGSLVGTVSTNVLADNISLGLFMHMDRAAGTARRCLWMDWVRFQQEFDSR